MGCVLRSRRTFPLNGGQAVSTLLYVGIDNGLTGGLVALSTEAGVHPVGKIIMPVQAKSNGNEVNAIALKDWLLSLGRPEAITVALETPGKHSPGAKALCSMWDSYGATRAVLSTLGFKVIRISPQAWQKKILVGCGKGDTKPFALSMARQLWPQESWLRTTRCETPHDGMIDAALIAEYARRERL